MNIISWQSAYYDREWETHNSMLLLLFIHSATFFSHSSFQEANKQWEAAPRSQS